MQLIGHRSPRNGPEAAESVIWSFVRSTWTVHQLPSLTARAAADKQRTPSCEGVRRWAMPGLNWRPLPCQGSALPLRQPPEVETGFEPVYTDLQSVASPLGHSTWMEVYPPQAGWERLISERTTRFELATLTLAR